MSRTHRPEIFGKIIALKTRGSLLVRKRIHEVLLIIKQFKKPAIQKT